MRNSTDEQLCDTFHEAKQAELNTKKSNAKYHVSFWAAIAFIIWSFEDPMSALETVGAIMAAIVCLLLLLLMYRRCKRLVKAAGGHSWTFVRGVYRRKLAHFYEAGK